jgi:hypothetical protein
MAELGQLEWQRWSNHRLGRQHSGAGEALCLRLCLIVTACLSLFPKRGPRLDPPMQARPVLARTESSREH